MPPLLGMRLLVISKLLDHAADRARELDERGYQAHPWDDLTEVGAAIAEQEPASVVIDLGLEVAFPAEVTQAVRQVTDVPVAVVGCAGTQPELLRVLEVGADLYCRPRCPTEEIDLRLRALWRRLRAGADLTQAESTPATIHVGNLEIDPAAQTVRKNGVVVPLSPTEYRLLMSLAERPGVVVPSKALIARVWGNQYASESHYLRLYVRYLRQKLEDDPARPEYIVNRWGAGYALETPTQAA